MKPKNKFQKEILTHAGKVKVLSVRQELSFYNKLFEPEGTISVRYVYCFECGHRWKRELKLEYLIPVKCPNCGKMLKINPIYSWRSSFYAGAMNIVDGFQVIRMFFVSKYHDKNRSAGYSCREVMQHWIREDGKMDTLSCNVMTMGSLYYDQWILPGELQFRTKSENFRKRCTLVPDIILPRPEVLPILRRNGFKGDFHGITPHKLLSALLSSNKAETLIKTKQFFLLRYMCEKDDENKIGTYWNSIRMCMRHKHIVRDVPIWLDHLRLLEHFGKDIMSPKYLFPANLSKEHQKYVQRRNRELAREKLELMLKRMKEEQKIFASMKKKYFNIVIKEDDITIRPFRTVREVYTEGMELDHCVYSNSYHMKGNSLLLSAKVKNKRTETVEFGIRSGRVEQSRGLNNKPTEHHKRIVELVNRELPKLIASVR